VRTLEEATQAPMHQSRPAADKRTDGPTTKADNGA